MDVAVTEDYRTWPIAGASEARPGENEPKRSQPKCAKNLRRASLL